MKNTKKNLETLKAMNSGKNWFVVSEGDIQSDSPKAPSLILLMPAKELDDQERRCEIATEIARRLNDYPNVVRTVQKCAGQRARISAMKGALKRIAAWPANSNSDPDVMGEALDEIQRIAEEAAKL